MIREKNYMSDKLSINILHASAKHVPPSIAPFTVIWNCYYDDDPKYDLRDSYITDLSPCGNTINNSLPKSFRLHTDTKIKQLHISPEHC